MKAVLFACTLVSLVQLGCEYPCDRYVSSYSQRGAMRARESDRAAAAWRAHAPDFRDGAPRTEVATDDEIDFESGVSWGCNPDCNPDLTIRQANVELRVAVPRVPGRYPLAALGATVCEPLPPDPASPERSNESCVLVEGTLDLVARNLDCDDDYGKEQCVWVDVALEVIGTDDPALPSLEGAVHTVSRNDEESVTCGGGGGWPVFGLSR